MRRHVLQTLTGSGVAQVFSVILYWACARILGPRDFGAVVALTTFALFLAVASNAGSAAFLTQGLASGEMSLEVYATHLWRRVRNGAIAALPVLGYGIATGASLLASVPAAVLVPIAVLSYNVMVVPRASSRFAVAGLATSIDKLVALAVAGLLFALTESTGEVLPMALVAGAFAGTAVAVLLTPQRRRYFLPRTVRSREKILDSRPASAWYTRAGLILAVQSLDVLALQGIAGPVVAGEYAAVSKWGQPLAMILTATNQVSLTRIASARTAHESRSTLRKTAPLVVAVAGIALLIALSSSVLVELLLGPEFRNSAPVLSVLMAGSVLSAVSQSLVTYFYGRRLPRRVAYAFLAGVLAQAAGILYLAPHWGALGGAIAWLVAQCAMLIVLSGALLRDRRFGR